MEIATKMYSNKEEMNSKDKNIVLSPFLNISHIVFSTNINARLGEGCETEKKKGKSDHLLSHNQIVS